MRAVLLPGFADPVLGAQASFRALLAAMAHPGRILPLGEGLAPPAPLTPAVGAVLLTLCDADTPLWTDVAEPARGWIGFHCGSPFAADPARAAFVLPLGEAPPLDSLEAGTDEEPHRSATLILPVAALSAGSGWRLTGPGIAEEARLLVTGAPPGFAATFAAQRTRFPRGVDVILAAPKAVACLPRTTRLQEE